MFFLTLLDHTLAVQGKILHTLTTISSTAHITAEMLKTIMYTLNYQNGMYIKLTAKTNNLNKQPESFLMYPLRWTSFPSAEKKQIRNQYCSPSE